MRHTTETTSSFIPSLALDRRQLLSGASTLALGMALPFAAQAQETPKRGGKLRLGMEGGSASDSLDPRTYSDSIAIAYSLMFCNQLVEIDSNGKPSPELAESWEAKPGAAQWIFNIRKGVSFGSGKALDADDVIYSLNLHRGDTKSAAKSILEPITDIKKTGSHQIEITMKTGNVDLPVVFTDYHLIIVANGTKDFSKLDGTGAYTMTEWQPGVRVSGKRKSGDYWKPGRGNFDQVDLLYIEDTTARTSALASGLVDIVNRLPPKTATMLAQKSKNILVTRTKGTGLRFGFVAQVDKDPYKSRDVMLGLKYGIDRQQIINNVFSGFASLGNDQTVGPANPFFNTNLKPKAYDPDKAKFHFKKAGVSGPLALQVSEGAYAGATDAAVLYQNALKECGISLDVKRVSGDGYWDNVWLKAPFCAVNWGNRPTADLQLSLQFLSGGAWNDTHYNSSVFDKLLVGARVEQNEAKRKEMYFEVQRLVSEEAGMVCFAVGDQMDGVSVKLKGMAPHPRYEMNDFRIAEKGWFA